MNSRKYEVGRSKITLLFGDITTSQAEALVSSDDYLLSMGGGVSAAIRRVGGPRVAADASKMVPARVGDVIVSTAGDFVKLSIIAASGQLLTFMSLRIGYPNLIEVISSREGIIDQKSHERTCIESRA